MNGVLAYHPDALDRRDPRLIERALPMLERINKFYFRVTTDGAQFIPKKGPVMFVGNHNGGILGADLSCTMSLLWRELGPASPLFGLAHDFAMRQLTPLGMLLQRMGAVSANRDNAVRVLQSGGQVLVYPGGDLDAYRHSARRNQVVILPRTGFVEVARVTGTPIVPIVAYGAHRSAYIFSEGKRLAHVLRMRRWARLERFPLALALPWGIAPGPWLPYFPLPFRVQLRVLPPVHIDATATNFEVARDIQSAMQTALDKMAA